MRIIQSMPFVFLIFSIFVSTIIAMMNNMSLNVFFKRTILFYIIIFLASKIFIHHIVKAKELLNNKKELDMVVSSKKNEIGTGKCDKEDEFIPLDLGEQRTAIISETDNSINQS